MSDYEEPSKTEQATQAEWEKAAIEAANRARAQDSERVPDEDEDEEPPPDPRAGIVATTPRVCSWILEDLGLPPIPEGTARNDALRQVNGALLAWRDAAIRQAREQVQESAAEDRDEKATGWLNKIMLACGGDAVSTELGVQGMAEEVLRQIARDLEFFPRVRDIPAALAEVLAWTFYIEMTKEHADAENAGKKGLVAVHGWVERRAYPTVLDILGGAP